MAELCHHYPWLESVRLPPEYTDDDMVTLMTKLPELASLESSSGTEEGRTFRRLPASVTRLSLTRCQSIRSWNLSLVSSFSQLRELLLYGTHLVATVMRGISVYIYSVILH